MSGTGCLSRVDELVASLVFLKLFFEQSVRIEGELTFATALIGLKSAPSFWQQGGGRLCFDLGGVTHADSAGAALLIEWLKMAKADGCELQYRGVPPSLESIIQVTGVGDLLPMERPADKTVMGSSHS